MDNTEKFIRAFWRRIWGYRNNYQRDLPDKMPVEFRASCETAMIWLREDHNPETDGVTTRIQQLEARNAELERLINDHNEGCLAGCPHHIRKNTELGEGMRWRLKCDDYVPRGKLCTDCPKDFLIALTAGEVD